VRRPVTIINPNSTEAMTHSMLAAAQRYAPSLNLIGRTSTSGPASIQGREDGQRAEQPLMNEVKSVADTSQGIIIGCFDDTALAEVSKSVSIPVIGIGQAAFHFCALKGWRFSVVTTLAVSVPIIEENIHSYGLGGFLGCVRASAVPVLELESNPQLASQRILTETNIALENDNVDAVVLGCAGMVNVVETVRRNVEAPIVDPIEAAAGCAGWLCNA
jgi:allantoin racemase